MHTFFFGLAAVWAYATVCHPVASPFTTTNTTGITTADININSTGDHSYAEVSTVSQATAAASDLAAFPLCVDPPPIYSQTMLMAAQVFMSAVVPVAAVLPV